MGYFSGSQPFFNRGTLSWNRSPDGTLHLWHLFYIQDLGLHIITFFLLHLIHKSIKFVFAKLNRSFLQAALSISCNFFAICRPKKSSLRQNCSLTQFLPETFKFG